MGYNSTQATSLTSIASLHRLFTMKVLGRRRTAMQVPQTSLAFLVARLKDSVIWSGSVLFSEIRADRLEHGPTCSIGHSSVCTSTFFLTVFGRGCLSLSLISCQRRYGITRETEAMGTHLPVVTTGANTVHRSSLSEGNTFERTVKGGLCIFSVVRAIWYVARRCT